MVYPPEGSPIHHSNLCQKTFCEHVADEFFSKLHYRLIRKDICHHALKEDLISLFREANELRIDIWKQSVDIRPHLLGSVTLGQAFQCNSNIMKAHCSVSPDMISGSRLWMAITPAIAAYWLNSAGEERSKVWAKAVVWAGCPKQSEMELASDEGPDAMSDEDSDKESQEESSEPAIELKKDYDTAISPGVKMETIESSGGSTISVMESLSFEELHTELYDDILTLEEDNNIIKEIIDLQSYVRRMLYRNEQVSMRSILYMTQIATIRLQARIRGFLVRYRRFLHATLHLGTKIFY